MLLGDDLIGCVFIDVTSYIASTLYLHEDKEKSLIPINLQ